MKPAKCLAVIVAALLLVACGDNTPLPKVKGLVSSLTGNHHFDHFVIIVLENEDVGNVTSVPYMDSLARRGVFFSNYYAVAHPSYPNYLALIAGKTFIGDNQPIRPDPIAYSRQDLGDAQLQINAPTLVDALENQKLTWDAFAEDYPDTTQAPKACDFRRSQGLYSRKHFPFLSFVEFHTHPEWCTHVRNLKWFRPDSLAAYTFIAPNLIHDGHDAPLSTAVVWVRKFLEPVLADSLAMNSTVIVITFDESSTTFRQTLTRSFGPNIIYTVMLGPVVQAGTTSNVTYSHFNMLRTVETNFGLSPSLLPDSTDSIDGIWK
jgi:hypothetical protein